jgi:hypothetical protein
LDKISTFELYLKLTTIKNVNRLKTNINQKVPKSRAKPNIDNLKVDDNTAEIKNTNTILKRDNNIFDFGIIILLSKNLATIKELSDINKPQNN